MKRIWGILLFLILLFQPTKASAHEAYVLSSQDFNNGLKVFSPHPFAPLIDTTHLTAFLIISIGVALSYILVLAFSLTKVSTHLDNSLKKISFIGPILVRLALSATFFFSALTNSFLGPELSLSSIPGGEIIRILLFILSILFLFGLFNKITAAISLIIFGLVASIYGQYLITYANYFGELVTLFLFGSLFLTKHSKKNKSNIWETPIIRICYGIALIYAGYTVKFLHQGLTVEVYNQYHLERFFHATGDFIAAGAGLSEIMIGAFILFGFMMRWTIIISLVFITLSLLYFQEMVWPHLILYGISLNLIINSADFLTIDHYLVPWVKSILGMRSRSH